MKPQTLKGLRIIRTAGFTLIELMVVMAVVAILALVSFPHFRVLMIQGQLEAAKPYLLTISSAQRLYYNRNGQYLPATNEQELEDSLGVDLEDADSFCFMVVTNGFITALGTPDYEVWAVLRDSANQGDDTVTVEGTATSCTAADTKLASTGWVQGAGEVGGVGRLVVLRYPPPSDGLDGVNVDNHRNAAVLHDWVSGISSSDALQP